VTRVCLGTGLGGGDKGHLTRVTGGHPGEEFCHLKAACVMAPRKSGGWAQSWDVPTRGTVPGPRCWSALQGWPQNSTTLCDYLLSAFLLVQGTGLFLIPVGHQRRHSYQLGGLRVPDGQQCKGTLWGHRLRAGAAVATQGNHPR
jgi:hypothetical protein